MNRRDLRIWVCGSERFEDEPLLVWALDLVHRRRRIALLCECGYRPPPDTPGADLPRRSAEYLAHLWARSRDVMTYTEPPSRETRGKVANVSHYRLLFMSDPLDGLIVFGHGRQAEDLVMAARSAAMVVWEPERIKCER